MILTRQLNKTIRVSPAKIVILVLIAMSLQACSIFDKKLPDQTPEQQNWAIISEQLKSLENWQALGKINVRTPDDSVTAAINSWTQQGDTYDINLSSTFLGLGTTTIKGNQHFIVLTESGEDPIISDQPDALIEASLGIPLPITNLINWIKASPRDDLPYTIKFNPQGLPESITQDNWQIDYTRYAYESSMPLPVKIKLFQNDTKITLVIKQWTLP